MQASAKLGLALVAAAFSGAICAEVGSQETVLKNQSKFKSTVGDEAGKKDQPIATPVVVPLTPVPAAPPVVEQPRPAPAPAWPSKIDTITIKQGTRR
jgi:hypothetical protein